MRTELVNKEAERYKYAWNDMYDRTRGRGIIEWMVRNVMRDVEEWVNGRDGNGANALKFSIAESRSLYIQLSSTARYYNYHADEELLGQRHG